MPEAPDQSHAFGGGASDSAFSPIVLAAMVITIVAVLILPRKYQLVCFLCFICLAPAGQQIYVAGVHWFLSRLIILVAWGRLLAGKFSPKKDLAGGLTSIDKYFFYCFVIQAVCVSLIYMQGQAIVNQVGFLIDFVGCYFFLRTLIRTKEDMFTAIKCLAVICLILGVFMLREQMTMQNAFGLLGGVRPVPEVREGKIRSQGAFQHSLMAGCFAATLVPLFFMLWKNGKAKLLACVGFVGCSVMTYTSQSSTPLLAYVSGILAMGMWPIRKHMQLVRRGIVATILGLAMVMKAPVWFIIAHIDLTGGSSGYHRAELIDQFVRHFWNWWLIGTKDAGTWAYDLWDTQNQYVNVGENGGLLAFVLFIAIIVGCFKGIGKARRSLAGTGRDQWLPWFLGAALFAHLVGFFGVNYFDQSKVGFFVALCMVPVVSEVAKAAGIARPKATAAVEIQSAGASAPALRS